MHKIYGITQGQKEVDLSRILPWVAEPGTKSKIDFYLWCLKGEHSTVLVDTGMTDEEAKSKCSLKCYGGVDYLMRQFKQLNVDTRNIEKVIITHLHGDHFSAHELYPNASFYIQKRDMEYFTGPGVNFLQVSRFAPAMAVVVNLAYAGRVHFLDGDEQIAPGIKAVLVGGHTPGSQIVVVSTRKGSAVIAGDAADLYRNLEARVIGQASELLPALFALDKITSLASSPDLIIPGHEPLVMSRFPNPVEGVVEIA